MTMLAGSTQVVGRQYVLMQRRQYMCAHMEGNPGSTLRVRWVARGTRSCRQQEQRN